MRKMTTSQRTPKRSRLAAITGSVLATAALTFGGLHALAPTDTMGAEVRAANFTGTFQAAEKPIEVVGQWARSAYKVNLNLETVAESPYSETPQAPTRNNSACAHGGEGEMCGQSDSRSGAVVNLPEQSETSWTPSRFGAAAMYWQMMGARTEVKCQPGEDPQAAEPEWHIRYGNASHVSSPKGMKELKNTDTGKQMDSNELQSGQQFDRLTSGQTFTEIHKGTNRADTYIEISITPKWGTNVARHEAWSELTITAQAFYQTSRSQKGPTWSYTLSSRCGLNMNDGTGSTGPSGSDTENGAILPEVEVESGAEIPAAELNEDAVASLQGIREFAREEEIQFAGQSFRVASTAQLSDEDVAHIGDVLASVAGAAEDAGSADGGAWIRREANGLPTVTLELTGGEYAQVTPMIDGPEETE